MATRILCLSVDQVSTITVSVSLQSEWIRTHFSPRFLLLTPVQHCWPLLRLLVFVKKLLTFLRHNIFTFYNSHSSLELFCSSLVPCVVGSWWCKTIQSDPTAASSAVPLGNTWIPFYWIPLRSSLYESVQTWMWTAVWLVRKGVCPWSNNFQTIC